MEVTWNNLESFTRAIERVIINISVVCLTGTMLVSVLDVVMRYALHKPFVWSYPVIANYLLVALVFLAMSDTQATRHHVGVDAIVLRSPERIKGLLQMLSATAILAFSVLIAGPALLSAVDAYKSNDVIPGIISWPKWPTYLMFGFGFAILALRCVCDAFGGLIVLAGVSAAPIRSRHDTAGVD